MTLEQGINPSFPYDQERDGIRFKPQFHRPGQMFRMEGICVTVNKQTPVRGTDWTPRNHATTVKAEVQLGATTVEVNSVARFAKYRPVVFDRGGAGEETHNIVGIDAAAKTITLDAGLANVQAVGNAVDQDQVYVANADGRTTVIEILMLGQNATAELAGLDLQNAQARASQSKGWADGDRFDGEVRVPYAVGASVLGATFCDECYEAEGTEESIHDSHESAVGIDPNYFLRISFKSSEEMPTEKMVKFKFGVWRA